MTSGPRKRVAVLISGRGSNLGALMRAAADPAYPAMIAGVVSNRADAAGLKLAEAQGVPARIVPARDFADRHAHDAAIHAALTEMQAEIICLAGYMRILSPGFVRRWQGRMINIHPALLPLFPGLDTHARALGAGVRVHGCTVHFVTDAMDEGPIIAQAAVPVLAADTEEALAARVLKAEHRLYPLALKFLAEGKVAMESTRAVWKDGAPREGEAAMLVSPAAG